MNPLAKEKIVISAAPTATPSVCKFSVDRFLYEGTLICYSKEKAQGSPFFEALFNLDDIREVLVSGDTLTVATHNPHPDWRILGKSIGGIIRSQMESGHDLFPSSFVNNQVLGGPAEHVHSAQCSHHHHQHSHPVAGDDRPFLQSPIAQEVQKLLQEHINPAVASHGGRIVLVDFKEGDVYLKMEGGCQGCGQASYTLRQGVEKAIKQAIPEIREVIDVTDHESGQNPFYS